MLDRGWFVLLNPSQADLDLLQLFLAHSVKNCWDTDRKEMVSRRWTFIAKKSKTGDKYVVQVKLVCYEGKFCIFCFIDFFQRQTSYHVTMSHRAHIPRSLSHPKYYAQCTKREGARKVKNPSA